MGSQRAVPNSTVRPGPGYRPSPARLRTFMNATRSAPDASIDQVSEEERIRHERFLLAVRQLLTKGAQQDTPVQPRSYAGGRYAKLLSAEEMQFLLR